MDARSNGNSFGESIGNGPGAPWDEDMKYLNDQQVSFWRFA